MALMGPGSGGHGFTIGKRFILPGFSAMARFSPVFHRHRQADEVIRITSAIHVYTA